MATSRIFLGGDQCRVEPSAAGGIFLHDDATVFEAEASGLDPAVPFLSEETADSGRGPHVHDQYVPQFGQFWCPSRSALSKQTGELPSDHLCHFGGVVESAMSFSFGF